MRISKQGTQVDGNEFYIIFFIQMFTFQHVMGLILTISPKVQVFWNFEYVLGLLHSNMLLDLEVFA